MAYMLVEGLKIALRLQTNRHSICALHVARVKIRISEGQNQAPLRVESSRDGTETCWEE